MSEPPGAAGAAPGALLDRFRRARRDPALTLLEGLHALKHALRFGADVLDVVTADREGLGRLARAVAPDVAERLETLVRAVDPSLIAQMTPRAPALDVLAIARRPRIDVQQVLDGARAAPIVLLEDPRSLGNLGACVRVAAAANAAALLSTGPSDPWSPEAVRGAAGLHYALPVARVEAPPRGDRPLVALDPDGERLDPRRLPARAVLAFGSERRGLSAELLARADARVRIPMRTGVSSLNLATSVATVLFCQRLLEGPDPTAIE